MNHYCFLLCFFLLIFAKPIIAQLGCTDQQASNYNPAATQNDGSCVYQNVTVSPINSQNLPTQLNETSGLIYWNNFIWTHNDDNDISLYYFEEDSVNNLNNIQLQGTLNTDQEEISQDSNFIYIGDFGNNANGNRTDLRILRINKSDLLQNMLSIDTIFFSYSDQVNFSGTGPNNTDFDCESFVVSRDSIFLFTKQWIGQKTALYSMPKVPGTYVAQFRTLFDVQGLVTGAYYNEADRLLVLSAYSSLVQPFLYLFYDFDNHDFFTANKRKISLGLPFHQVEGICSPDGLKYFISNERLVNSFISVDAKIHELDLRPYLDNYLNPAVLENASIRIDKCKIFPNPVRDYLYFDYKEIQIDEIRMVNLCSGQNHYYQVNAEPFFDLSKYGHKGLYQISIKDDQGRLICEDKILIK